MFKWLHDNSLGNRLLVANLPTNMLCGLVLLAGEFGVNAESWFAGMRLNVQEIHDPQARVSYRQASEIIRRALPTLPIDGVGLAMGEKQNGGNFGLLGLAMKELPLGTAYAIWTGVGAVGTVIAGIILFGESMALFRLASVALIIAGLIGLKISA